MYDGCMKDEWRINEEWMRDKWMMNEGFMKNDWRMNVCDENISSISSFDICSLFRKRRETIKICQIYFILYNAVYILGRIYALGNYLFITTQKIWFCFITNMI